MVKLLSGKLTSKGQLTIPIELRRQLNIEEGDRLEFILDDSGNISSVKPVKKKSILDVVGRLKSDQEVDFQAARQAVQLERNRKNTNIAEERERYE